MSSLNRSFASFSREYAGITAEIENRQPLFTGKDRFNNSTFNKMFEQHKTDNRMNEVIGIPPLIPEAVSDSRCGYAGFHDDEMENANIVSSMAYSDVNIYDKMKLKDSYTKADFKQANGITIPKNTALTPGEIKSKINRYKSEFINDTALIKENEDLKNYEAPQLYNPQISQSEYTENIYPRQKMHEKIQKQNNPSTSQKNSYPVSALHAEIKQLQEHIILLEQTKDAEITRLNKIINSLIDKPKKKH